MKQYDLPGSHEVITVTVAELETAKVIHPAYSPYNSPIWPVQNLMELGT
jgi:hypothetical protein